MLTIYSGGRQDNCEGYTRREFLQVGTLGIGGLTLSGLFAMRARAAGGGPLVKDKAVVLLNLQGGASHIETFDPKMTAPAEYRDVRRGADEAAGTNSPRTGMPNATIISPPAVGKQYQGLGRRFDEFAVNLCSLPAACKPFDPSAGGEIVQNMKLRIPERRLGDRRALLTQLDSFKRRAEQTDLLAGADPFQQQAFDVLAGGVSDAFDIGKKDPKLVARYDTGMFEIPESLANSKSNKESPSPIARNRRRRSRWASRCYWPAGWSRPTAASSP